MTLEKVVDEIIDKAKEDALALKKEGKSETVSILKKAKADASLVEKNAVGEAEAVIEAMEKKEIASTKLRCKRIELDAKKEVIDMVFGGLKEKVLEFDDKTKKKIYGKMIKKAMDEIADARCVYVNAKDRSLVKSIAGGLEVKEAGICGGVIVENKEGNVRIDCTFDSVLEDVSDEYLKDVSKILFKNL